MFDTDSLYDESYGPRPTTRGRAALAHMTPSLTDGQRDALAVALAEQGYALDALAD